MNLPNWRLLIPLLVGVAALSVVTVIWPPAFGIVLALLLAGFVAGKVFNNPFLGVLWIVILLPFERVGSVDVGALTVRLSHLMGLWTLLAWLWQKVRRGDVRLQPNPLLVPIVLFMLVYLVGLVNAINLQRGVLVFAFTLLMVLIFVVVSDLIDTREKLWQVIKVWIWTAFFVSGFGLFQWVGDTIGLPPSITQIRFGLYNKEILGMSRLHSTALEPLYYANYALTIFPTILALLLAPQALRGKHIAPFAFRTLLLVAGTMGLAYLLTLSRGGYLALAVSVLVLVVLRFRGLFSRRVMGLVVLGVVALISFVGVTAATRSALNLAGLFDRATSVGETSADLERFASYREAYGAFLSAPWLGIGPGNYGAYVTGVYRGTPDEGWDIANNEYLELLAETGLIGISFFLLILIVWSTGIMRAIWQKEDPLLETVGVGFIASLMGMLMQYMTFSTLYMAHLWVFLAVGVAAARWSPSATVHGGETALQSVHGSGVMAHRGETASQSAHGSWVMADGKDAEGYAAHIELSGETP